MPLLPEDVLRNIIADQAIKIAELQAQVRQLERPNSRGETGPTLGFMPYGGWISNPLTSVTWSGK